MLLGAMVLTGLLAGGGAYYLAKDRMQKANFGSSINLIRNDDNGGWCELGGGQTFQNNDNQTFCAIGMPKHEGTKK